MRGIYTALVGVALGLGLACGSSPSTIDASSPQPAASMSSDCDACSARPPANSAPVTSSVPSETAPPPPACSAWKLPTTVTPRWDLCERQPQHDTSCAELCPTRAVAWTCPDEAPYDITCVAQGDHQCCADMHCVHDLNVAAYCPSEEGAYFCYREGPDTKETVSLPGDMGCTSTDDQLSTARANCCPFNGP